MLGVPNVCDTLLGDVLDLSSSLFKGPNVELTSAAKIAADLACDIEEIKPEYLKGLTFHYVTDMSDVIRLAITNQKVQNAKTL